MTAPQQAVYIVYTAPVYSAVVSNMTLAGESGEPADADDSYVSGSSGCHRRPCSFHIPVFRHLLRFAQHTCVHLHLVHFSLVRCWASLIAYMACHASSLDGTLQVEAIGNVQSYFLLTAVSECPLTDKSYLICKAPLISPCVSVRAQVVYTHS